MTKVVKAISVRRNDSIESYRVGDKVHVHVGEEAVEGIIYHIDRIEREDGNRITHVHYDVYAKVGENRSYHIVTITDMPVEIQYGYRPF